MKFSHRHTFAADADTVIAMLASEDFARYRANASGSKQADAVVDGSADQDFTVSIRREIPATTIPEEFRSFVGSSLDVRYVEAWEPPGAAERVGTFAVEITGAPGRVTGALELSNVDEGSEFFMAGDAIAPVPLFGHIIEKTVADGVLKAFKAELVAADEWLARA